MAPSDSRNSRPGSHNLWKFLVLALFPFAFALSGCNDTCFSFTSNPPNGNITIKAGDPKPSCTLNVVKAAVRVVTHTVSTCNSCSPANQVRQIVVNLRGVEIHPGVIADSASPDWRELLPGTSPHRLQLDLAGRPIEMGTSEALGQGVTVPAATYRQLRLRFWPNRAVAENGSGEEFICGDVGANCVVMGDGRVLPLLLEGAEPEIRMTTASGFLFPPDSSSDLVVEFGVTWLLSSPDGQGSRILPALTASASIERLSGDRASRLNDSR